MDWFASQPHYSAHLEPIRLALDAPGRLFGTPRARWGEPADPTGNGPICVASAVDAQRFPTRPVIYIEHGAGQNYRGDPAAAQNPSYSGGPGLGNVRLFICPSRRVADAWRHRYPDAATAVTGCARLDQHQQRRRSGGPVKVGFVFHWNCLLCPETRTAWPWWRSGILQYAAGNDSAAAHCHPRAPEIQASLRSLNVRYIDDVDDMLRWADVIVGDNTSVLYEACAIGLSTVALNAPWYRRDVEHGMRFWSYPPGPQIDDPVELVPAIEKACGDPGWGRSIRYSATIAAYGPLVDGHAAQRAADAIRAVGLA